MGFLTPDDIKDFRDLYTLQLRYLLSAENQAVDGLDAMTKNATDEQLKQVFQSHKQESQLQAQRMEQMVTAALNAAAANIVSESKAGPVRDAGLIASAQKVEHFEIASYGSARDWARILGLEQHAQLLDKTLSEEKHTDELLNQVAQKLNPVAVQAA